MEEKIIKSELTYDFLKDEVHRLHYELEESKKLNNAFIKKEELNKWVADYFPTQDLISPEDLINTIEDLDDIIRDLKNRIDELEYENSYPSEERDREREVIGL